MCTLTTNVPTILVVVLELCFVCLTLNQFCKCATVCVTRSVRCSRCESMPTRAEMCHLTWVRFLPVLLMLGVHFGVCLGKLCMMPIKTIIDTEAYSTFSLLYTFCIVNVKNECKMYVVDV